MSSEKYQSRIEMNGETLVVKIKYEGIMTETDDLMTRKAYRKYFSLKKGLKISIDEIEIKPCAGDRTSFESGFGIQLGRQINYEDLRKIHERNPEALERLREDLTKYAESRKEPGLQLANCFINGIDKFLERRK